MIKVLHLYYDLLNLYGENANTRCIKRCLELNNIKVRIDLKSIKDELEEREFKILAPYATKCKESQGRKPVFYRALFARTAGRGRPGNKRRKG